MDSDNTGKNDALNFLDIIETDAQNPKLKTQKSFHVIKHLINTSISEDHVENMIQLKDRQTYIMQN
jgi:hypothetical protein